MNISTTQYVLDLLTALILGVAIGIQVSITAYRRRQR